MRILSLDGGGCWAIIQALALQRIHGATARGWAVLADYDLVIANSGGSIVLAGLMLNKPLDQIVALFNDEKRREAIFHRRALAFIGDHFPIVPKYSTTRKREGLLAVMAGQTPNGARLLGDLPTLPGWPTGPAGDKVRCVIVAFNYDVQRAEFFRTYSSANNAPASKIELVDAVNASTNAPIKYFDAPAECGGHRYWDGAMGAYNNPVMAGVVEALSLGTLHGQIRALSIGTGTARLPAYDPASPALTAKPIKPGLIRDLEQAALCLLDDPPDAATYSAHVVLGNKPATMGSVVRMSPVIRPVRDADDKPWQLPPGLSQSAFTALVDMDMDAIATADMRLIQELATAWLKGDVPNQPVRFHSATLAAQPGDDTFADAETRWRALP